MRILQISHNYHIVGGSDRVFFATMDLLQNAGHEVVPFCMANERNAPTPWSRFFPTGADTGAPRATDALRYFYNSHAKSRLEALLDQIDPIDIAHLHIYHGKQTPAILRVLKKRGIPVVQTLHEYKLACPIYTLQRHGKNCTKCVDGSRLNAVYHRCKSGSLLPSTIMAAESWCARILGDVRLVDQFICVSEFQRKIMQRAGIPDAKLTTLHNFVPIPDTHQADPNQDYLFYFGRIEKLKGLATLVEAVSRTGQTLVIAGDGQWVPALLEKIAPIQNIQFVGFQSGEKLQSLLRNSRAVVIPSEWYENCPMSLLEAKANAKPVIAAHIGGIPELVRDGKDGFLFAPGDVDDLARALNRFEQSEPLRLGRAAVLDARTRFSGQAHLAGLMGIYGQAITPDYLELSPAPA